MLRFPVSSTFYFTESGWAQKKKSHLWVDEEKYFHIKSPPFLLSEYHGREWGGEGVVEKADDVGGVRWICVWCCMGHTERRSGRERRRKNKLIDIRNVYYFKVLFPPSHIPVQLWVSALLLPLLCLFFPSSTACLLCRVPSFDGDCTFMFLFQCFCCRFCFFFRDEIRRWKCEYIDWTPVDAQDEDSAPGSRVGSIKHEQSEIIKIFALQIAF